MTETLPADTFTPIQSSAADPALRRSLALIFFILLLDVIGITILIPVTPYIVGRYSGEALMVTMMTVIYAAAQFFAAPLMGKLSDRYGRRPVLLVSVFGSAIGYLIFGFGGALWVLLLARLIDGVTAGNMSTASAYIADVSRPEDRAKNFSLIGIAWGVGLILGPALGSVFSGLTLEAPAFAAAGLSFISVLLAFFFLPESLPKERRETERIHLIDLNPFASIGVMLRKPGLGRILLVLCLFNFAFNGINNTQSVFAIQKFDAQPWQIGLVLVLVGIAVVSVQFGLVRRAVAGYGEKTVATFSLIGLAAGYTATFFMPSFWLVCLLTVLANGISAFTFPTMTALSTNAVQPREVGLLMGVTTALTSLMTILGPLWAGVVYDRVMPGSPYWMGAVVFLLAAFQLARARPQAIPE
jgi:MFS transporter, DHA1 family, tetracycline resistance protein